MIRADVRFDGFSAGQTSQVLFHSGAFSMVIVAAGASALLQASVGTHAALTFPGLQRGRWYRIVWAASKNGGSGHYLHVRPWDIVEGGYLAGSAASDCVYQAWTAAIQTPGSVYVGHDGSAGTTNYFKGRIDNLSLLNYHYAGGRPAACTQQ